MALSVKTFNTINNVYDAGVCNKKNLKASSVTYNTDKLYVALANTSIMVDKYPDYINQIRNINIGGTYLRNVPSFCKILAKEYSKPRADSIGVIMNFVGFEMVCGQREISLSFNDVQFINEYKECNDINAIYIFKKEGYTEFWFEVNSCSDEVEDDIFRKYSFFKKSSDSVVKIIVFSKDELYEGTNIEYDILLMRKG